jgi:hypothetical protein
MTPQNKKIAMYVGGAVVLGAVGFFVYSFFQKPITVGQTTVTVGKDDEHVATSETKPTVTQTFTNPFTDLLGTKFEPIKKPNLLQGFTNTPFTTSWTKGIADNNFKSTATV